MVETDAAAPEFPHSPNELPELLAAVAYWATAIVKNDKQTPTWKLRTFQEELFHGLKRRCEGHWYPETPDRGQGYRALICAERVDTLLLDALRKAQLAVDLRQICGEEVVMYVDPGNVSVRMFPPYSRGRRDITQTLYSTNNNNGSNNNNTTLLGTSPPTNPTSTSPPSSSNLTMYNTNSIHRAPIVQIA